MKADKRRLKDVRDIERPLIKVEVYESGNKDVIESSNRLMQTIEKTNRKNKESREKLIKKIEDFGNSENCITCKQISNEVLSKIKGKKETKKDIRTVVDSYSKALLKHENDNKILEKAKYLKQMVAEEKDFRKKEHRESVISVLEDIKKINCKTCTSIDTDNIKNKYL